MSIFRNINNIELEIIKSSFNKISTKLLSVLENLKNKLYISINSLISEQNYPLIYLSSNEHPKIIKEVKNKNKILAAGLYFGFIKKGMFYFSIEGVEYLYKQKIYLDFKRIHVNELGEKSVLYGNNVLNKMIVKTPTNLNENDFLVIHNEKDEIIAIAKSVINNRDILKIKPNDICAVNLSDKGIYLRKDQ